MEESKSEALAKEPPQEEDVCMVCTEKLEFVSIGECNHQCCCALCALKLRMLSQDKNCIYCKQAQAQIVIVNAKTTGHKLFQDFGIWGGVTGDGIVYDDDSEAFFEKDNGGIEHQEKLRKLRQLSCGMPNCPWTEKEFDSKEDLERHLKDVHSRYLCNVCWEFNPKFAMEHIRYTHKKLKLHIQEGDKKLGEQGHPLCRFCKKNYYNNDMLYKHLNSDHESCHVCRRLGQTADYFRDRKALFRHFKKRHFVCEEPTCKDLFKVFANEMELQTHNLIEHPEKDVDRKLSVAFTVRRAGFDGSGISLGEATDSSNESQTQTLDSFAFAYRPGQDENTPQEALVDDTDTSGAVGQGLAPAIRSNHNYGGSRWASAAGGINMHEQLQSQEDFPSLAPAAPRTQGSGSWATAGRRNDNMSSHDSFSKAVGAGYGNLRFYRASDRNKQRKKRSGGGDGKSKAIHRDQEQRTVIANSTLSSATSVPPPAAPTRPPVAVRLRNALGDATKFREFQEICGAYASRKMSTRQFFYQSKHLLGNKWQEMFHDLVESLPDEKLARALEDCYMEDVKRASLANTRVSNGEGASLPSRASWGASAGSSQPRMKSSSNGRAKLTTEDFPALQSQAPATPAFKGNTAFERFEAWKQSKPKKQGAGVVRLVTNKSKPKQAVKKKKKKKKNVTSVLDMAS